MIQFPPWVEPFASFFKHCLEFWSTNLHLCFLPLIRDFPILICSFWRITWCFWRLIHYPQKDNIPTLKFLLILLLEGPLTVQVHNVIISFSLLSFASHIQVATKSSSLCSFIISLIHTCKFNKYLSSGRNTATNRSSVSGLAWPLFILNPVWDGHWEVLCF